VAARDQKTDLACDEWCKTLTPSNELRKAFHSEAIDFDAFSQAYREELAQHQDEGLRLANGQKTDRHAAVWRKEYEQNHALVLADWLRHL
jgi:uncharacterized protein YeaO (DUF488 family)